MIARFIWSVEHSFNEMSYFFSRILLLLKLLYRKTGGKHWGQVLRLFVSCQVLCEIEMFNISRGKLLIDFFFFSFPTSIWHCVTGSHSWEVWEGTLRADEFLPKLCLWKAFHIYATWFSNQSLCLWRHLEKLLFQGTYYLKG